MDTPPVFSFNASRYPEISVHLLIEMFALQQATLYCIMDEMEDQAKADRIFKAIKEKIPALKEKILEQTYESFGRMPDL